VFSSLRRPRRLAGATALLLGPILVTAVPQAQAAAVAPISFAPAVYYPTGVSGSTPSADENTAATADLLGNGRQDVVCACQWEGDTITIMYNNGNGAFQSPGQSISTPPFTENVVTGQFTNSGRTDIVVLTATGFELLANQGGGNFTVASSYTLEQAPFQDTAVAADFNGDGHLDLAIKTPLGIQVEFGNGNGTFTPGPLTTVPSSFPGGISAIVTANVDNNGHVGLFAVDAVAQQFFALAGNGNGTFTLTASATVPFVPGSVMAGDVNRSGVDSALVTDEFNAPARTGSLYVNDGHGGFAAAKTYNAGLTPISGAVGDFNHDGNADFVSSDTVSSTEVVLASDGQGNLVPAGSYAAGTFPQGPVVADFNGDGKQDLVVPAFCPGSITNVCLSVLLNTSPS
jgi:FG-GAP-like repeat/FG-GAP repeat